MKRRTKTLPADGSLLLWSVIAICVVIEAAFQLADGRIIAPYNLRSVVYDYAAFWPGLLGSWEPNYPMQPVAMFVTYGFLHGGLAHLGFNMVTLWSLGRIVLYREGPGGFLGVYFASMIGGGALFGLMSPNGPPMVGASGALFGLAGAILLWLWRAQPTLADSLRATWRIYAFLILYNVVVYFALDGGLAWETHLGGFLAGWLLAWIFDDR